MDAKSWFITFHLIGLFIYLGGLLNLSRLLGYHVREEEGVRKRLSWMEKRMYFFVTLPGLALALIFGLLLLFGVGQPGTLGDSLGRYFKPKDIAGSKSFWYVTFHLKFVIVAALLGLDFYMGRQIVRLDQGKELPPAKHFKILHGLMAFLIIAIVILMKAGPLKGNAFATETPQTKESIKESINENKEIDTKTSVEKLRQHIEEIKKRPEQDVKKIKVVHILIAVQASGLPGVTRNLIQAEELAAKTYQRALAGEDFHGLVKELSDDSGKGIYTMISEGQPDRGKLIFLRSGMVPAFGNVGWKLKPGEVGVSNYDTMTSPYGFHIIKRLE